LELTLPGGGINYRIQYQRAKSNEPEGGEDFQLCTGVLEVTAISNYIQCFKVEDQRGRFFRKLRYNSTQKVVGSQQVVGRHTAANVGKEIANALGFANFESYTGHCWRRVTGTWAADAGLSLPEIKQLTGHKSDHVVQGYIDKSIVQKRKGAAALEIVKRPTLKTGKQQTLETIGNSHGIHVTINVSTRE
jgi:hypothetical protein